jgi:hypothetical protein
MMTDWIRTRSLGLIQLGGTVISSLRVRVLILRCRARDDVVAIMSFVI